MENSEVCKTGIQGLDDMLGEGMPAGWNVLVCGGPGSGKTTLCAQFLANGAKLYDDIGLLVLLEENFFHYAYEMDRLGLDLSTLVGQEKIIVIDASPLITGYALDEHSPVIHFANPLGQEKFALEELLTHITEVKKLYNPKRLVIDSISSLRFELDAKLLRKKLLNFYDKISSLALTTLIVSEIGSGQMGEEFSVEQYLSQGVILVHRFRVGSERIRGIEIFKLRGVNHDVTIRPFTIEKNGIHVYPKEKVFTGKADTFQ